MGKKKRPWRTLDEISAATEWDRWPEYVQRAALAHAASHVELEPGNVRIGPKGREYSPEASAKIVLCLRGRGRRVDGRIADLDELPDWGDLHAPPREPVDYSDEIAALQAEADAIDELEPDRYRVDRSPAPGV
jgi:hypothetical protein